ncbi:transmembrane protein, putative [Medicago truncatula]|uniref:Transmembrane protein, putative n=1 Tax=Medicago truncatula TaxID=3880 RepID=A0A072VJ41_MEDTR|nr:transmembrane protein, putative [Medicago truncatula]
MPDPPLVSCRCHRCPTHLLSVVVIFSIVLISTNIRFVVLVGGWGILPRSFSYVLGGCFMWKGVVMRIFPAYWFMLFSSTQSVNLVNLHACRSIRVIVACDPRTGKITLICASFPKNFGWDVARVLQILNMNVTVKQDPLRRGDTSDNHVIVNIKVLNQLRKTNTVVLAYACDRPMTVESLSAFWLPCLCQNLELVV